MAPRTLAEPYQTLLHQIIETMLAGNGGKYPESHSDMNYCVRGLLKMYDVKRRPLAIELPYADEAIEYTMHPTDGGLCENCGEPLAAAALHEHCFPLRARAGSNTACT